MYVYVLTLSDPCCLSVSVYVVLVHYNVVPSTSFFLSFPIFLFQLSPTTTMSANDPNLFGLNQTQTTHMDLRINPNSLALKSTSADTTPTLTPRRTPHRAAAMAGMKKPI